MDNMGVRSTSAGQTLPSSVRVKLAVVALVPALLLLDTGIAVARGWQLGRLDFAMMAAASLVVLSICLAAASRRSHSYLQNHGDSITYVSISALAAWVAAEALVASFVYFGSGINPFTASAPFHTRPRRQHFIFMPDKAAFPGITGVSHYTTNSLGLRGPEFQARETEYRILTIGGSTTECVYLDDSETWQRLLMQRLNQQSGRRKVLIASAGIAGYSTVHHLRFVAQSPLMRQVDALVFLIGANDFNQFLRGNLRDGLFRAKEMTNDPKHIPGVQLFGVQPIWRYSPILGMVRDRWQRRKSAIQAEDSVGSNTLRRRLKRQSARIRSSVPGLDEALRRYETRVEALVRLARSSGLRPIFVTQPTLWDKNLGEHARALLWRGDISEDEYLSVEAGREAIDRYNDVLMHVCETLGAECISTTSMHGQEQYYYDDFHFNEAGAAELARIIAAHLIAHASVDDWAPASMDPGRDSATPGASKNSQRKCKKYENSAVKKCD